MIVRERYIVGILMMLPAGRYRSSCYVCLQLALTFGRENVYKFVYPSDYSTEMFVYIRTLNSPMLSEKVYE